MDGFCSVRWLCFDPHGFLMQTSPFFSRGKHHFQVRFSGFPLTKKKEREMRSKWCRTLAKRGKMSRNRWGQMKTISSLFQDLFYFFWIFFFLFFLKRNLQPPPNEPRGAAIAHISIRRAACRLPPAPKGMRDPMGWDNCPAPKGLWGPIGWGVPPSPQRDAGSSRETNPQTHRSAPSGLESIHSPAGFVGLFGDATLG